MYLSKTPTVTASTTYQTGSLNRSVSLSQIFTPDDSDNVVIVKKLAQAKFPIFLAFLPGKKQYLALKAFNFQSNKPHVCFNNEVRFAGLNHTNIINIIYADQQMNFSFKGQSQVVSCILMEYAPYGTLSQFMQTLEHNFTEKMARTYFRQLIQALDYLHDNGVCHFDIKPENLLIGDDYQLKIADFDLSYVKGDAHILTQGSKNYRAPEIIAGRDDATKAADIYSAAIILFTMKCKGVLPYIEHKLFRGVDMLDLLENDTEDFFESHAVIQEKEPSFFDQDFQELFVSMTRTDPERRVTIEGIKMSKWYNGPVYSAKELKLKLSSILD